MADDSNALTTITAERYARALEKVGAAGRPAEPPATERATFAQRAEEILEQGRPRPPAVEDVDDDLSKAGMLAAIGGRIEAIVDLAHSRDHANEETYTELQPELCGLLEARDAITSGRVRPPDEADEA